MKTDIVVEYKEYMTGETISHRTSSKFIAQKLVESLVDFAQDNDIPLYETKLKVISYKTNYMQCAIAIEGVENAMFRMVLHYN